MSNKMSTTMKTFFLTILFSSVLFAGTYDDNYGVNKNAEENDNTTIDYFMHGNFDKVIHFKMLSFDDNELDENSISDFNDTIKTIKEYVDKNETILVTIIGHTSKTTDDKNELAVDSDTYANKIQNIFRFSLNQNESENYSKSYAYDIRDKMMSHGIDKKDTVIEYRSGQDEVFNATCAKSRDLSNRVMVTMYVLFPVDAADKESFIEINSIEDFDLKESNSTQEVNTSI